MSPTTRMGLADKTDADMRLMFEPGRLPTAVQRERPGLQAQAERLWPDDPVMQEKWRKAIRLVRSTRKGWLLDRRQERCRA